MSYIIIIIINTMIQGVVLLFLDEIIQLAILMSRYFLILLKLLDFFLKSLLVILNLTVIDYFTNVVNT